MKSALGLFLGVSVFATVVGGCDGGGDEVPTNPPIVVAGNSGSGTASPTAGSSTGGSGGGALAEGVPLNPTNGWVDGASNGLKVQGAMFPFGDPTSLMGSMPVDFSMSGTQTCFSGTAAKVDMTSAACVNKTYTPPAKDCYGEFWGAAIGLNLNQQIDAATGKGGTPAPFNGSALKGFAFEISGTMVPSPKDLRFKVEDATGEYCNVGGVKRADGIGGHEVKVGPNSFVFSELVKECWMPPMPAVTAEAAKPALIKIAWQVVTNATGTVPFNFCVSNVRALQ